MNAKLWRKSHRSALRYFKSLRRQPIGITERAIRTVEISIFRTAWAMGYRAGKRSAKECLRDADDIEYCDGCTESKPCKCDRDFDAAFGS